MKRISDKQLGQIEMTLIPRDRLILEQLSVLRYLKTNQIQRLFFDRKITWRARVTTTMRTLNRLHDLGLIDHFPQRIGGVRAGSDGIIWYLSEAGARLLDLGKDGKRTRALEPSSAFLRHTLAVSECFVQITEICRMSPDMKIDSLDVEPVCWRAYQKDGKAQSLRPDLYAETATGKYADHWFIEMDLATESTNAIVDKCRRYQHYYQTRKEQDARGVFPIVLWIVPTEDRKQKMIDAIRFNFGNRYVKFNLVITPNELWSVITEGPRKEDLC